MKNFPKLLSEARISKGLTQREVAEMLGISISNYQRYEYDVHVPGGDRLLKLINILDLDLDEVQKALKRD